MSTDWQKDVKDFMEGAGQSVGYEGPTMPDIVTRRLRAALIAEEAAETIAALGFEVAVYVTERGPEGEDAWTNDLVKEGALSLPEVADGIADSIYVLLGTAIAAGVDLRPVWDEVQRANMDKLTGPVRADGKRLKPEGWRAPDIDGVLARQGWAHLPPRPGFLRRLARRFW